MKPVPVQAAPVQAAPVQVVQPVIVQQQQPVSQTGNALMAMANQTNQVLVNGTVQPVQTGVYATPPQMVVVTQAPPPRIMSRRPVQYQCPQCGTVNNPTAVNYETGTGTWLMVGGLCVIGCVPCCCAPLCIDDCKDALHVCKNCNTVLGRINIV